MDKDMNKSLKESLLEYMEDTCTPAEKDEIEKWLILNMKSSEYDEVFRQVYEEIDADEDLARKLRTNRRLSFIVDSTLEQKRNRRFRIVGSSVAASLIALLSLFCTYLYIDNGKINTWNEVYAAYGQVKRVDLPDGSTIWLHDDTKILYPTQFGRRRRQIYVAGEVYADIKKDKSRPFYASSNGIDVRVLGTEFNMKAYSDSKNMEVTLIEGKVALDVSTLHGVREYELEPGDIFRADRETGKADLSQMNPQKYTSWKDKRVFYFMDCPLSEIVTELQRSFGTPIIVKDKMLLKVHYYASFVNGESLDEILESLNSDNAMNIEHFDNSIVISQSQKNSQH